MVHRGSAPPYHSFWEGCGPRTIHTQDKQGAGGLRPGPGQGPGPGPGPGPGQGQGPGPHSPLAAVWSQSSGFRLRGSGLLWSRPRVTLSHANGANSGARQERLHPEVGALLKSFPSALKKGSDPSHGRSHVYSDLHICTEELN